MDELNDILGSRLAYRPKIRSNIPLVEYSDSYHTNGFVIIPVYMSKKDENPDGFKLTAVRSQLINGHAQLSLDQRAKIQATFIDCSYAIIINKDGFKEIIVVGEGRVKDLQKRGMLVRPLVKQIATDVEPQAESIDVDQSKVDPEPETKAKSRRGRKKS